MALYWNWSERIGTATIRQTIDEEVKEFNISLYEGNAFLIFINEYKDKETGEDMYNMYSFFCDEAHAKNCLGLTKGYTNIFNEEHCTLVKVTLDKAKYSKTKKLVDMLIKAFDDITIEITSTPVEERK